MKTALEATHFAFCRQEFEPATHQDGAVEQPTLTQNLAVAAPRTSGPVCINGGATPAVDWYLPAPQSTQVEAVVAPSVAENLPEGHNADELN